MTIEEYLADRWEGQYRYFSKAARENKKRFEQIKLAEIVLAALIPFCSILIDAEWMWMRMVVGGLGVVVTILGGMALVKKYQDNWVSYRVTAEALKSEKYLFLMKSGIYAGTDAEEVFVNRVETILGDENQKWRSYVVTQDQAKTEGNPPPGGEGSDQAAG